MSKINQTGPIDELLKTVDPKVDCISTKLLLLEAYETNYRIFDHDVENPGKPLALVAMHPKENASLDNSMQAMITRYRVHEIYKHFGISLTEFLQLPREYVQCIFADVVKEATKENGKNAALLAKLGGG